MSTISSDIQIFAELQNGDEKAFRYFFDKHVGLVQYIGTRFHLAGDRRDDLVQEVFLKFFKSYRSIQSEAHVASWLAATARNWMIDEFRRSAAFSAKREILQQESETAQPFAQPDEAYERKVLAVVIEEVLLAMKDETGIDDFKAFYLEGAKVQDLGSSQGTVTSRLTRLRKKFRTLFEQRYFGMNDGSERRRK